MNDLSVPPKPEKPSPHECCGTGCVPCIYDYYYERLDKWNEKYGELEGSNQANHVEEVEHG